MTAILKTLPTRFARGQIERFFGLDGHPCWTIYFFTLGRGKPAKADRPVETKFLGAWKGVDHLYFTHRGILMGHFAVDFIVQNVGQLPKLTNMDGDPSAWQIKGDRWVAVCNPPFFRLAERIYHEPFRGWRYFDLDSYRSSFEAKVRL